MGPQELAATRRSEKISFIHSPKTGFLLEPFSLVLLEIQPRQQCSHSWMGHRPWKAGRGAGLLRVLKKLKPSLNSQGRDGHPLGEQDLAPRGAQKGRPGLPSRHQKVQGTRRSKILVSSSMRQVSSTKNWDVQTHFRAQTGEKPGEQSVRHPSSYLRAWRDEQRENGEAG